MGPEPGAWLLCSQGRLGMCLPLSCSRAARKRCFRAGFPSLELEVQNQNVQKLLVPRFLLLPIMWHMPECVT